MKSLRYCKVYFGSKLLAITKRDVKRVKRLRRKK